MRIPGIISNPFSFSFIKEAKEYSFTKFKADIIAALTVAIVALPQSMAYAIIAGVNPKYGLYAAIVPVILSSLFGSSKFLIAGPTNAISMVVFSTLASVFVGGTLVSELPDDQKIAVVFLLAFLVGAMQIAMGVMRFGSLVHFISHSVVVGFSAGAAVLIAFNQLKNLLGVSFPATHEFFETVWETLKHAPETNMYAAFLGLFTIGFILAARRISKKIPGPLLAMILSAGVVALFGLGDRGVKLIGEIPQTLPPISIPPFSMELMRTLFMPALAIAILGIVEAISIAKSIANDSGEKIDGDREFVGQGFSNMAAGLFSAIPGSGSFTRSAVNFAAGASTRFAGAFSGVLVLIILLVFAPLARFIPIASLAGILMVISYSMVNFPAISLSYRATKADRVVLLTTFCATLLLELEIAVYIGVILSIALFLRKVSHPQVTRLCPREGDNKLIPVTAGCERECPLVSIYQIDGSIFFGAINELEERLSELENGKEKVVVLRMRGVRLIDASGVHALEKFLKKCKENGIAVIFTNVRPAVIKVFRASRVIDEIGEENITEDTTAAIERGFTRYITALDCRNCPRRVFRECRELVDGPSLVD